MGQRRPELDENWLVQPLGCDDLSDLVLGEAVLGIAQDVGDGIARQDADDDEREDIGEQDDDNGLDEALCGIAQIRTTHAGRLLTSFGCTAPYSLIVAV